jgi:ATP-dependent exoDNAse (exonuclease V) beta subunit
VRELFEQLAGSEPTVEWEGPSGQRHVVRACRPADSQVAPAATEAEPVLEPCPPATTALDRGWTQTTVTALVHPAAARPFVEAAGGTDAATGRLVHRIFQAAPPADASADTLRELARRLDYGGGMDDEERDVVESAVATFLELRGNESVRQVLASGQASYEVPFSLRLDTSRTVVRGAIDCVALPSPSEAVVLEIKTGRPAAWHRAQLDLYVEAARQLFPGRAVRGMLVYPGDSRVEA